MSDASKNNEENTRLLNELKSQLMKMDMQKQTLEAEAQAIVQELTLPGENGEPPMGIDTPLVDFDGFPRADIDLYRARSLRKRFHEIQTDHKELLRQIEVGLAKINMLQNPHVETQDAEEKRARSAPKPKPTFDKATGKWIVHNWDGTISGQGELPVKTAVKPTTASDTDDNVPASLLLDAVHVPFAVIDAVAPDSPAREANLMDGDLITQFGPINYTNHRNLKALMEIVYEAAENKHPIEITLLRRRRMSAEHDVIHSVEAGVRVTRKVEIVPRPWGGVGLLGCHIVGYANEDSEAAYEEPTLSSS